MRHLAFCLLLLALPSAAGQSDGEDTPFETGQNQCGWVDLPGRTALGSRAAEDPEAGFREGEREAFMRGLRWLVEQQSESGRWVGRDHPDEALTGLALLSLRAGGVSMTSGPHKEAFAKAIKALLNPSDAVTRNHSIHAGPTTEMAHSICTLAFAECFHADRSVLVKRFTNRALAPLGKACTEGTIEPGATPWALLAIEASRALGLEVTDEVHERALTELKEASVNGPDQQRPGLESVAAHAACSLISRGASEPDTRWALRFLAGDIHLARGEDLTPSTLLFTSIVAGSGAAGTEPVTAWSHDLRDELLAEQRADGSWGDGDAAARTEATLGALLAFSGARLFAPPKAR